MSAAWIASSALLLASAGLSAAETALFSLSPEERRNAGPRIERLFRDPQALFATVLLANLAVNVLFLSAAAELVPSAGPAPLVAVGLGALLALAVFGELLPKALALRARGGVARWVAGPVAVLFVLLAPVVRLAQRAAGLVLRAAGDAARPERGVSAETLAEVLDQSARAGLIDVREADLLAELVELGDVRVAEILTPRVDMITLDLSDRDEERRWFRIARALAQRITWMPVVRGGADEVVGLVRLRDVLAKPDASLESLVQPVVFVPALASVLDLLRTLRSFGCAEAVVVDEYGGTAGIVTLESVFEEIVGDLRVEGERETPTIEALGGGRFRAPGALSIRDWNERFGREVVPAGFETVGGLVGALLGRIPREGDVVAVGGITITVRAVRGRRVEDVELRVAAPAPGARELEERA
ncbi:MAG: HlyC/CorC family transporter [Planctomycetes bacterium]|nr:HlyC/CorC family transporter [Planctomycetota bacterium]